MDVSKLFENSNTVPAKEWQGTDPETAQALYGITEVPRTKLESLIDSEIVIIGKLKMQGDKGVFVVYLYVPKTENLQLCTMAVSSKSFNERVDRSKLPVRGTVHKTASKKPNKDGSFNTYYVLD